MHAVWQSVSVNSIILHCVSRAPHTAFDLFVGTFENKPNGPLALNKKNKQIEANEEKINQ